MEDYNKIIESLNVRFSKTKNIKILNSINIENYYDVENRIILIHKGEIQYEIGDKHEKAVAGDIVFIPGGKMMSLTYGSGKADRLSHEELLSKKEHYFIANKDGDMIGKSDEESFSYVAFEAKVFDSVNFFASLDIPPFVIKETQPLSAILMQIIHEELSENIGRQAIIKLETEKAVIELMRYILEHQLFVEQLATNITYFKDPRLLDIFAFIKEHLEGDLSNKILANVANVSEDYVGQYFKTLTGINPQDYIEYQRMERAVHLLRTTKKSIREIGREVGYKDTAYFCRRFKMMFGVPAGKMRKRESLINI